MTREEGIIRRATMNCFMSLRRQPKYEGKEEGKGVRERSREGLRLNLYFNPPNPLRIFFSNLEKERKNKMLFF